MVVLAVKLHQLRFEVLADAGEDAAHIVQYLIRENTSPVFSDEDQMDVH
jgi:hypothetical protein